MEAKNIPVEQIIGYGVDEPLDRRPGVPMEIQPRPLREVPEPIPYQETKVRIFKRVGLNDLTPVFGTSQPPRGLSGVLRSFAYRIPEHKASHWGLLLLSDRVDIIEGLLLDSILRKPYVGMWITFAAGTFVGARGTQKGKAT